ncbi:MAG TPA: multiheme c-type cytochrome [Nannocystaceae bacterium]|nr:multiheme c-type cytochrome [Nannocystaceae bacterium]
MGAPGRLESAVLFGPAALWGLVASAGSVVAWRGDDAPAVDRRASSVVGAEDCRRCHPGQFESWHASYHRTMTQPVSRREGGEGATSAALLAPFAGESLAALGFVATMDRDASGEPRMRIVGEGGEVVLDVAVELAVGSHRVQQYVARIDRGGGPDERWRLPVAWHVGEGRWIHLNGAFLAPDGERGSQRDFLRHLARWNDNCLFCHNTEPAPGLASDGTFASEVAEYGIACEACHGPASAHVERHADPWTRMWSVVGDARDGSIVQPAKLGAALGSDVCGRCHGQRIGRDIAAIMRGGDGFLPGEPLAAVSRPIWADSVVHGGAPGEFAARFWADGTPRLSAYEYQGLLSSPCFADGDALGCGTCHTMHGDEPNMQLRADWDPVATCTGCHAVAPAHGGHDGAVECTGCHMPRITYGLLEGMISHRVSSPDPARWIGRHDQPDACTQCHVDRSRRWAADAMAGLGLAGSRVAARADEREAWASRVVLDLLGGDPVARALAAHALTRPEAAAPAELRISALAPALVDDYAAVRWFAWRGVRALATELGRTDVLAVLAEYDVDAALEDRLAVWQRVRALVGPGPLDDAPEKLAELEADRDLRAIWIGE